jgi:hypothetical protein
MLMAHPIFPTTSPSCVTSINNLWKGVVFVSLLSKSEIETLVKEKDGWHASIFMPTHRLGDEIEQDPIRFKNLVNDAQERLIDHGMRLPKAKALLEPLHELVNDRDFWRHQSDGLAVFISPKVFRYYRVPLDFAELVVITDRFHVKPLLPLLSGDGHFYVLALSHNEIRLLQGTRFSVGQVDLHNIPESLNEALKWDDPERRLQWHTSASNEVGIRSASFHGHGVDSQSEKKEDLQRYFQKIDAGLNQILPQDHAPLILAGVDYLLSIYDSVNSYPHLLEEEVRGNPEELKAAELHARAWNIVEPVFQREVKEAAARYRQLAGQSRQQSSDDIKEIVPAAYFERVDVLFLALNLQQWGTFDPDANTATLHSEPQPGDEDLYDLAAVQTFLNNGVVYALKPDRMPTDAEIAAIFRY